tara:strand:+ start:5607 stop:5885 length:279 start_codon:yes stop_codon:yes gene_type:complete
MKKPFKSPNPNDFFQIRKLKFEAPHLEYIDLPFKYNIENSLEKWITDNCKNRFYIKKTMAIADKQSFKLRVGFEDPKEMSYFVLACPLLKYK